MLKTRIVSMVLALFLIYAIQADAISHLNNRKFLRILADIKSEEKVSPAPSPGSVSGGMEGSGKKADPSDRKGCLVSSRACHVKDLSACLLYAGNAPKEALVLQNSGEVPLRVRVTLLPANVTYDEIQLARQQIKEVNVTAKVEGSTSIVLNAGNGNCIVRLKQPTPGGNFYKNFPYVSEVSPIHGVYLFFATVLVIGGVWTCCKFGKSERHVDVVPYQELEMSRTEADSPTAVDVEMAEGWDESWEDDWGDEIREVKSSPGQSRVGNGSANGHMSKSSKRDGWDDNWND